MSYNDGTNFGYDQFFINPVANLDEFSIKPEQLYKSNISQNNLEETLKKKMWDLEQTSGTYRQIPEAQELELKKIQDLIEKENIRRSLEELKRKNDILTIFIIFLTIFVLIQYNAGIGMRYSRTMAETHLTPNIQPTTV